MIFLDFSASLSSFFDSSKNAPARAPTAVMIKPIGPPKNDIAALSPFVATAATPAATP